METPVLLKPECCQWDDVIGFQRLSADPHDAKLTIKMRRFMANFGNEAGTVIRELSRGKRRCQRRRQAFWGEGEAA